MQVKRRRDGELFLHEAYSWAGERRALRAAMRARAEGEARRLSLT